MARAAGSAPAGHGSGSLSRASPRFASRPPTALKSARWGPGREVSDDPAGADPAARRLRSEGYSIWLLLPARTGRRLALLIARLARRCGTAPFIPHVTLLGGIVLSRKVAIERTTALARVLRPFPVRLRGLGHEAVLYRCLYLRAAGPGLRPARARSLRLIGSDSRQRGAGAGSDRFRPHLSLVYGRLAYAERRRLTREIEGTFNVTFTARRIALVRTSGDHTTWRVVAVRRLRS